MQCNLSVGVRYRKRRKTKSKTSLVNRSYWSIISVCYTRPSFYLFIFSFFPSRAVVKLCHHHLSDGRMSLWADHGTKRRITTLQVLHIYTLEIIFDILLMSPVQYSCYNNLLIAANLIV